MTDASSRLERLRKKHKALLSSSNEKIAQSRSRLDWYSEKFEGSGRKFFFQEKKGAVSDDELSTDSIQVTPAVDIRLKEENSRLKDELKELQAEREKLRKNLSQVAVQVQNASKAILSTKLHEANAKYSSLEVELRETQDRLEAKETSTGELLNQMQKLRKENAKLSSQVRLNTHTMTGSKNNQIKELQERITDLEDINRDLTLEKAKTDAKIGIQEEDRMENRISEVKSSKKERSSIVRIRDSNMTMIQTQLAVSAAQLTSVELELADKEHEIDELHRSLDRAREDNSKLRAAKGQMVDNSTVDELKNQVEILEIANRDLMMERMNGSMPTINEEVAPPPAADVAPSKTEKRLRDTAITMMKTELALANAQLSSTEQELAEKDHELMALQLRLDEANSQLDSTRKEKRDYEKKLVEANHQIYELENNPQVVVQTMAQVPTNIAVGVGGGEIGGTFDFGAASAAGDQASVKIIQIGNDDQTARSAITGYTDASSMAQTYAMTIVQTKLADSHAKYADLELKFSELKGTLDTAMVELGTKQSAVDISQADLNEAREKNAAYSAEMETLKAQIAVLEDKQIKALKRQMRRAQRAEAEESEEEEEEVIALHEHRSALAIVNTKLQETNVRCSQMEREMDELADMLESTLLDGEGKRAIIESLNTEIIAIRKENADLYTQLQENEAINDVLEGARIQELETKLMGLEMLNQQLMLQQIESDIEMPEGLLQDEDETVSGSVNKVEKLERKIRGLEKMNKVLSERSLGKGD